MISYEKPPYLVGTSVEHCSSYLAQAVQYRELPSANVLVVFDANNYLLATVKPPEQDCAVYLHSRGDIVTATIQQVFNIIQTDAVAWCEF